MMPVQRITPEEADALGIPRMHIVLGPVPVRPEKAPKTTDTKPKPQS